MLRAVCVISGVSHILTAWELGRRGILRLAAYDPMASMTYETHLSKIERVCLGYEGEDFKSWGKLLCRRLSLRRTNGGTGVEGVTHRGGPLAVKETMVLDKTVFSTACRLAAGRIDAGLFRMRAMLVDAGESLALDLYHNDSSKQCRMLLTADDLLKVGLRQCEVNAEAAETAGPRVHDMISTDLRAEDNYACGEQGCAMARILVGTEHRETAIRHLARQLRFTPDSNIISLSIDGDLRTSTMTTSHATERRQPKKNLRLALPRPTGNAGLNVGCGGYAEGFLKRRRSPTTLLYGDTSALIQHSQEKGGKKLASESSPR